MSAICDAHKKKVDVERLYNPGEDRKSGVGDKIRWIKPAPSRVGPQTLDQAVAVGDQTSWRSEELEIRCGMENQHPAEWDPSPLVEQLRRTGKKGCYGH